MDSHVVGVMLVRPWCASNLMSFLSEEQQVQRRFWMCTKYSSNDLIFLEVVRAEPLNDPFVVWSAIGRPVAGAFFHRMSPFSAEKSLAAECWSNHLSVAEQLRQPKGLDLGAD
jgi:hypothetical protein